MSADDRTTPEHSSPSNGDDSGEDAALAAQAPNGPQPSPSFPLPKDGGTRSAATQGGSSPNALYSALLLGSDYTELEEIAIREITPELAIGISRGRFPKGYPHVDPNEDAVYAATDGTTTILSVADGHHGFDAARAVITTISEVAPLIIEDELETIIRTLGEAAIRALATEIPALPEPRDTSRTSLTVCALRDTAMATATIGDSACFVATRRRAKQVGRTTEFLAPETPPESLRVETTDLSARSAVVVTTDGLVDFVSDIGRTLRSTSNLGARAAVEHLLAAAFSGGAGDNVATVVHRFL